MDMKLGAQERSVEDNIWTLEEVSNIRTGKFHSKEPRNLYSPPDIIRAIKSRRAKWSVHVACMEEVGNSCKNISVNT
jgi:hypothetical protein